jgi:integrase/recombinase XerC
MEYQSYLKYLVEEKKYSPLTTENYKKDLELFFRFLKNSDFKDPIDVKIIRKFLAFLYEKKYSKKTISRMISALRGYFKFLYKNNQINENPMLLISNPKKETKLPNFLYYDQLTSFIEYVQTSKFNKRDYLIVELLYSTGIRVSELVNLKLTDIDIEGQMIRVKGKGNKERIVIFGEVAKKAIIEYIENERKSSSEYLILNSNNQKITTRGVEYLFEKYNQKSKMNITPHTLRHTFATHMLNEGADLKSVQELLGHENLSTTQVYTHVSNERLRSVYLNNHPRAKK